MSSDNNGLIHLLNNKFASATAFNSLFINSIPTANLFTQNAISSPLIAPPVPNVSVPVPNSSSALLHLQLLDLLVKAQQIVTAKADSGQIGQQSANTMCRNWTVPSSAAFDQFLPKQHQHYNQPSPADKNKGEERKNMHFSSASSSADGSSPVANCAVVDPINNQCQKLATLAHPSASQNPSRRRRRPVANMDNTLDGLVAKRAEQMPTPMKRRYQSETEAIELPDDEQETKRMETDPDVCTRMCSVCGYQGKWVSEMIRHKRVHTAERPFKCKYCNRTSKWKADLIRHVAKTHGIRVVSKYSRSKALELDEQQQKQLLLGQEKEDGGEAAAADFDALSSSSSCKSGATAKDENNNQNQSAAASPSLHGRKAQRMLSSSMASNKQLVLQHQQQQKRQYGDTEGVIATVEVAGGDQSLSLSALAADQFAADQRQSLNSQCSAELADDLLALKKVAEDDDGQLSRGSRPDAELADHLALNTDAEMADQPSLGPQRIAPLVDQLSSDSQFGQIAATSSADQQQILSSSLSLGSGALASVTAGMPPKLPKLLAQQSPLQQQHHQIQQRLQLDASLALLQQLLNILPPTAPPLAQGTAQQPQLRDGNGTMGPAFCGQKLA